MNLRPLLPYAVLGPVTGWLFYGCVSCLRARRPWMAAIYAAGLVEFWTLLPLAETLLLRITHG